MHSAYSFSNAHLLCLFARKINTFMSTSLRQTKKSPMAILTAKGLFSASHPHRSSAFKHSTAIHQLAINTGTSHSTKTSCSSSTGSPYRTTGSATSCCRPSSTVACSPCQNSPSHTLSVYTTRRAILGYIANDHDPPSHASRRIHHPTLSSHCPTSTNRQTQIQYSNRAPFLCIQFQVQTDLPNRVRPKHHLSQYYANR